MSTPARRRPTTADAPRDGVARLWSDGFGTVGTRAVQWLAVLVLVAAFGLLIRRTDDRRSDPLACSSP